MSGPLIIDAHMHVFESKEQGRRAKASYEGWEFGDPDSKPPYSDYAGDVEDALAAIDEAGASKAVMVHFFLPIIGLQDRVEEPGQTTNCQGAHPGHSRDRSRYRRRPQGSQLPGLRVGEGPRGDTAVHLHRPVVARTGSGSRPPR